MISNFLRLTDSVGSDRPMGPVDTINTKMALRSLGRYETPDYGMTDYPDAPMFEAIGKFQKEKKLHFDRMMFPGGETETAINNELKIVENQTVNSQSSCHSVPGYTECLAEAADLLRQYNAGTDQKRKNEIGLEYSRTIRECDDLCQDGLKKPDPSPKQPEPGV